jgi:putative tricarboxylic transport membrane protein
MTLQTTKLFAILAFTITAHHACADDFPSRPVRILVPYAAGGPSDTGARLVAEPLSRQLGTSVFVENRGGAGGLVATEAFLRDPPDGYTILLGAIGPFAVMPAGKKVGYDIDKDFIPLGCIWLSAQVLVANPKLPAKSLRDFVTYAKANPGKVTIGSAGVGAVSHLTIELFKREAGIDITHVPFRSTGASLPNVVGGQIDAIVGDASVLAPQVEGGTLNALAVASSARAIALPSVPTMSEAGLPGVVSESWFGLVLATGTPAPIVARLQAALLAAQKDPAYLESLRKQKVGVGEPGPESFARLMRRDADKWRAVIQSAGITFD